VNEGSSRLCGSSDTVKSGRSSKRPDANPLIGQDDCVEIQDRIRKNFEWDLDDDLHSARALQQYCSNKKIDLWKDESRLAELQKLDALIKDDLICGREIAILGAAVEPGDVVVAIENDAVIIAADGAIGVISDLNDYHKEKAWRKIRFIVSDADGDFYHLQEAARRHIPFILHAHGDNEDAWFSLLEEISDAPSPIILTHQTPAPIQGMYNPGGFTDGDRAVCIALSLGVNQENLALYGFRTDKVGKWTGATIPEVKMEKLQWMATILDMLGVIW